jgi:hypothetical protein
MMHEALLSVAASTPRTERQGRLRVNDVYGWFI